MWHLYVETERRHRCFMHTTWEGARAQIIADVLPMLGRRVHPLMATLVNDATPERPWTCACETDKFLIKLRPVRQHEPVEPGQDIDGTKRSGAC